MKWKTVDIDINSPRDVLNLYSERLYKEKEWECLSLEKLQNLFIYVVSDYYDHGLSLDVLISISEFISSKSYGQGDTDLMDVIVPLGDLDYYLRNVKLDDRAGDFIVGTLKDLYKYFEKNKHMLINKDN